MKVGYLDQHTVLEPGMTVRSVLQKPSDDLFVAEARIVYGDGVCKRRRNERNAGARGGELQEIQIATTHILDAKIDEVACALGVAFDGQRRE